MWTAITIPHGRRRPDKCVMFIHAVFVKNDWTEDDLLPGKELKINGEVCPPQKKAPIQMIQPKLVEIDEKMETMEREEPRRSDNN